MRERGRTGLGLALLSAAAFGTSGAFAASLLAAGWTPGAAVTIRVVIAALVLTPAALLALRGRYGLLLREARTVAVYGCAAVAGCQLAYFHAVEHLSVAVALLLEYSGALLVVGWLWLRNGQRPRRLTVAGALGSVAGLALVLELTSGADVDLVGVLWGLGAAVGLAVYFVLSAGGDQEAGESMPPLVVAWGGLAVGGAVLLAAAGVGVLPMSAPRTDVVLLDTQVSWLVPVLGLSVVAAALAYVTGIVAARLLGAKVASFVGLTEVLFAVAVAWLLLGQQLSPVQLVGGILVVAGIALVRLDEGRGEVPGALVAADEGLLAAGNASR